MAYRINKKNEKLRENPETSRSGSLWTSEEDKQLMDRAYSKMAVEQIALEHKRTAVSVKLRIMQNVLNISQSGESTLEALCERVNIPLSEITEFKEGKQKRAASVATPTTTAKKATVVEQQPQITSEQFTTMMSLLTEIRDLLQTVANNTTPKP